LPISLSCEGATETAFHRLCKELLQWNPSKKTRLANGEWFTYTRAVVEERIAGRIVDVMLYNDITGHRLAVEIWCTHPMEKEKIIDLQTIRCPALEIDVSDFNREIDPDQLLHELVEETWNKEDFRPHATPLPASSDSSVDWFNAFAVAAFILGLIFACYWSIARSRRNRRRRYAFA
jgi:hypothetical protein